jgi:nucleoid-associated protein YgaU
MGRPQKIRTVLPGETIDAIAFAEYGDASRWRAIADFNHLDNPLRLRVGQQLALPPLR